MICAIANRTLRGSKQNEGGGGDFLGAFFLTTLVFDATNTFFISNVVMCSLILAHCGGEGGEYFFILFLFVYYTFQSVLVSNMNFNDFFIFFLFYLVNAQESRGVNALSKKSF